MSKRLSVALAVACGLAAGAMAFVAAQPYPGATVDSGEYLAVADGIVDGHGLTMPYLGYDEPFRVIEPGDRVAMTQFPPLYPATLAAVRSTGVGALSAARLVGAISFALTVAIAVAIVLRGSRSVWAGLLVAALLVSADLVTVHAMAWSETVMLAAFVGALAMAIRWSETRSPTYLVGAGVLAVVASGARFVGLAAVAGIGMVLFLHDGEPFRRRLRGAAIFVAACTVPTLLWFVRNATILGQPSEKEVGLYLPGARHLGQALATFGGWVVPWRAAMPFVGGVLLLGAVFLATRLRRQERERDVIQRACMWFGVAYLAFVVMSRSVLDQNIAFDFRILSPLYVILAIAICSRLQRLAKPAVVALAVIALASVGRGAVTVATFRSTTVAAYTGENWRESPTLARVGELPDDTYIITNAPDPIWIWHGRVVQLIPPRSSLYSGKPNEAYASDVREIHRTTACRSAVVVFFDQPTRKPRRFIEPLVVSGLRLDDKQRFTDGEIYDVTEPFCRTET